MMNDVYATVPGDVVFYEDFRHTNALIYHYLIQGDLTHQQALCDSWLNVPWQKKYRFSPAHPFILVSFVNSSCAMGNCSRADWCEGACTQRNCSQSLLRDENGQPLGYFKFNILSMNLMVAGMGSRPLLFSPYTFCDDGTVTANYRELLGWNVLFSELDFPTKQYGSSEPHQFSFRCAMDVPRNQTYEGTPPLETMMEMSDNVFAADKVTNFSTLGEAMAGIPPYLHEQFTLRYGDTYSKYITQISRAMLGGISRMSLRQFRGTTTGEKAIFQSLQTFEGTDLTFKAGGIIPQGQVMNFPSTDAITRLHFPLCDDLGLGDYAEVIAGCWMLADYSVLPETIHWTGIRT